MMKILMINTCCGTGSTGRICTDIAECLTEHGHEVKIAYGRDSVADKYGRYALRIGNDVDVFFHALKARLFDAMGLGSYISTKKFLKWVDEYNPDIIHLHNIHGYYINIELLFKYLRDKNKVTIWTLHDCWSFTGHCVYFDFTKCEKWKEGCKNCYEKREYPVRWLCDHSSANYALKKKLFSNISNLTIVTPSEWLSRLIKESFLRSSPVKVINNGVDTSVFRYKKSSIKKRMGIEKYDMILGVASVWDRRKGLNDFIQLSQLLDDKYKIVVVGVNQTQIKKLPDTIVGIEKTENVNELVELYSSAKVYVNLTYEDNYPTTNIEAISCGTPVITYSTGGSVESANKYGCVVPVGDVEAVYDAIKAIDTLAFSDTFFDSKVTAEKYLHLYKKCMEPIRHQGMSVSQIIK